MKTFARTVLSFVFAASLWTAAPTCLQAQQPPPEAQQATPGGDPIRDLNLSPEQRERIRAIREETRDERAAINQRLRERNRALEEVLDSDNPSDAVVEKHLLDVAEAQAASLRMRISTEMKVRRVLTPEQLTTLRTLRQNARNLRRERQLENNEMRRRDGIERRRMPNRNTMVPGLPRRLNPNRPIRP
jgi:Spy/CpxP family protein refolding chaperone